GDFKANTKYTVSFDKSMRDEYKQTLRGTNSISINVGQSSPQLVNSNDMVVLKANSRPSFTIQTRNVKQVKVSAYAATADDFANNYAIARQAYSAWHEKVADYPEFTKFKKLDSKLISIKSDVESYASTSVDLKPYLKNGLGHVILTVEKMPRVQNEGVMRFPVWIQVTNLGIDAYNDADTLLAMVTKLDDGSPVPNAQLTLVGANISAHTDKSGLATLHPNSQYSQILMGKSGDDIAFLNSYGNWRQSNRIDSIRWYSVTDRNLYKPGEHVQVKGWARKFGSGPRADLSLLGSTVNGLDYQINDGNGSDIGKGHCNVDDSGSYNFEFDVPKTANLGTATIRLTAKRDTTNIAGLSNVVSTCNFSIQEFRRPEFEMNVKSSKGGSMLLGESTDITASAKYFAGGALPDAPVHWTVTCSEGSFSPPGFDEFNFGRKLWPYAYFFGIRPGSSGKTKVSQFDGKTDGNGKHVLAVKLKSLPEMFPESVVAEGTVSDVNRQEWSDKATILVHPADVYVGVKTSKQFYHSNDPVVISSVVCDLDGKTSAGKDVHIDVLKERNVFKDNKYQDVREQISSKDFKSTDKPSEWTLDLKEGGSIKIEAFVTDSHGRKNKTEMTFYREDKQPEENKKVEKGKILLISDKTKYQVGETAEILVQAPVADCHGIVTVRRNGIASSEPINISG
ncbi:MAG: hypothetical protein K2X81_20010, partial [Candidatus Obscuribacterales bacterium]|nr:hypothetical protein [Candidatus Obscuribacterales bacterium]